MSYAEKIKEIRKQKGLSQEQLAEVLDVSRQCVTKWEAGKCYPEADNLLVLAREFDVSLDWLFSEEVCVSHSKEDAEISHSGGLDTTLEKILNNNDQLSRRTVTTGYAELDRSPNGILRNEIYIIAGPPAMGTTALALSIANNVSRKGSAIWFSYKETKEELWKKLLNIESGIEHRSVKEKYTEDEVEKIKNAAAGLKTRNLEIINDFDYSIEHVMEMTLRTGKKFDLIVIDSLDQLMTNRSPEKDVAFSIITECIDKIRRNCGCPILLLDRLDYSRVGYRDYGKMRKIKTKHEDLFYHNYYYKWIIYRKHYFNKDAVRPDGREDVDVFMSHVNWDGKVTSRKTAKLIYNFRTYSFCDTDVEYEKPDLNIATIIEEAAQEMDDENTVSIDNYEFTEDMKLKLVYTDLAGAKKEVCYSYDYDGRMDLEGDRASIPEAYCLGILIGEKIEAQCW